MAKDKKRRLLRLCRPVPERELMALLSPRERDVVRLFIGLDDGRHRSLEEISQLYGATEDHVTAILVTAMKKLEVGTLPPHPPPDKPAQVAGLPRPPVFADYRVPRPNSSD